MDFEIMLFGVGCVLGGLLLGSFITFGVLPSVIFSSRDFFLRPAPGLAPPRLVPSFAVSGTSFDFFQTFTRARALYETRGG